MGIVGIVAEAVVLIFVGVGLQGNLHPFTGQFTQGQGAHSEQHFLNTFIGVGGSQLGAIIVVGTGCPLGHHPLQI